MALPHSKSRCLFVVHAIFVIYFVVHLENTAKRSIISFEGNQKYRPLLWVIFRLYFTKVPKSLDYWACCSAGLKAFASSAQQMKALSTALFAPWRRRMVADYVYTSEIRETFARRLSCRPLHISSPNYRFIPRKISTKSFCLAPLVLLWWVDEMSSTDMAHCCRQISA